MSVKAELEKFEAWLKDDTTIELDDEITDFAWYVWKAATAELALQNEKTHMTTQLEQDVALAKSVGIRVSYGGLVADKPAKDAIHALCNAIREQDAKQDPVCYMQENQPYVYVSETKNEGSGYTIPLYTSPPNAKAIEVAALMKAVKALEANEQFYARDTIKSLITELESK